MKRALHVPGTNTDEKHSSFTSSNSFRGSILFAMPDRALIHSRAGVVYPRVFRVNFSNLETYNPDLGAEVVPLRSFPEQQTNNLSDDCHFRTLELLTHLPGKWMRD